MVLDRVERSRDRFDRRLYLLWILLEGDGGGAGDVSVLVDAVNGAKNCRVLHFRRH